MIRPLLLAAAPAAPAATTAQTFGEAVRANVAIGIRLCAADTGGDPGAFANLLRSARFDEREVRSEGDVTHHGFAPADTARAEPRCGQLADECRGFSSHPGVTDASRVLDETLPTPFPPHHGRIVNRAPADPATGQPALRIRYQDPTSPIPHVIGVWPGGQAQSCVENGTSVLNNSSAV